MKWHKITFSALLSPNFAYFARFLATRIREGNIWSRLKQPLKTEVSKANGLGQLFRSNKEKDSVAFISSCGGCGGGSIWFKDTKNSKQTSQTSFFQNFQPIVHDEYAFRGMNQ